LRQCKGAVECETTQMSKLLKTSWRQLSKRAVTHRVQAYLWNFLSRNHHISGKTRIQEKGVDFVQVSPCLSPSLARSLAPWTAVNERHGSNSRIHHTHTNLSTLRYIHTNTHTHTTHMSASTYLHYHIHTHTLTQLSTLTYKRTHTHIHTCQLSSTHMHA
jgi:hypothetical protein